MLIIVIYASEASGPGMQAWHASGPGMQAVLMRGARLAQNLVGEALSTEFGEVGLRQARLVSMCADVV